MIVSRTVIDLKLLNINSFNTVTKFKNIRNISV